MKFGHAFAYFVVLVYLPDGAIIEYTFMTAVHSRSVGSGS